MFVIYSFTLVMFKYSYFIRRPELLLLSLLAKKRKSHREIKIRKICTNTSKYFVLNVYFPFLYFMNLINGAGKKLGSWERHSREEKGEKKKTGERKKN